MYNTSEGRSGSSSLLYVSHDPAAKAVLGDNTRTRGRPLVEAEPLVVYTIRGEGSEIRDRIDQELMSHCGSEVACFGTTTGSPSYYTNRSGDTQGEWHQETSSDIAGDSHAEVESIDDASDRTKTRSLVGDAVTVVVNTITASLDGCINGVVGRMCEVKTIVAVPLFPGHAIAVVIGSRGGSGVFRFGRVTGFGRLGRTLGIAAVTILIDPIFTDILGRRVHRGVGVVAVAGIGDVSGFRSAQPPSRAFLTIAVTIGVGPPGFVPGDRGVGVVTVAVGFGVTVTIVVVDVRAFIDRSVAVVIHTIRDLGHAGVHVGVGVVTVGGSIAVTVIVDRVTAGVVVQINVAVAVVVDVVGADFGVAREGCGRAVVAVGRIHDVVLRVQLTSEGSGHGVTITIAIIVVEPEVGVERRGFVNGTVAVVVDSVAVLVGFGIDVGVGVVTVAVGFGVTVAIVVIDTRTFIDHSVAIIVHTVRNLGHAGVHEGISVVTVEDGGIPIGIHIHGRTRFDRGTHSIAAIAVLVGPIFADIFHIRMDVGIGLVAVEGVVVAITVGVDQIGPVTVLVDPVVGDLRDAGVHAGIGVVAVRTSITVAIVVDHVATVVVEGVDFAVAVVVDTVTAVLARTREDAGVGIFAVAFVLGLSVTVVIDVVAVEVAPGAVVVNVVAADLFGRRVHRGVGVVAVADGRVAVGVFVHSRTFRNHRTLGIAAVAILISSVFTNILGRRVHRGVGVVAVSAVQHSSAHDRA